MKIMCLCVLVTIGCGGVETIENVEYIEVPADITKHELLRLLYSDCVAVCEQFPEFAEFYAEVCPGFEAMSCDYPDPIEIVEYAWTTGVRPYDCDTIFYLSPQQYPEHDGTFDDTFKRYYLDAIQRTGKCPVPITLFWRWCEH